MTGLRDQPLPATCVAGFLFYGGKMGILYPDKPFKTYQEQIDILENRYGLIIQNKDFAECAIRSFTYYDLVNGYKDCFMVGEKYKPGTNIEQLYMFAVMDRNIQGILFKFSAIVENSFKSKLAYVISDNFGVMEDDYLNPANYNKTHQKIHFSSVLSACDFIRNNAKKIPQPTRHYCERHNHVPPWILFKNLSFSNSINLYQLLKPKEKEQTAALLIKSKKISKPDKIEFVIAALTLIRTFRNKIAHNLKFVTFKNPRIHLAPKIITRIMPHELISWKDIRKQKRGINDIYAYILCLVTLLDDPFLRYFFLTELHSYLYDLESSQTPVFVQSCQEYYKITNLPSDFTTRLANYLATSPFPNKFNSK